MRLLGTIVALCLLLATLQALSAVLLIAIVLTPMVALLFRPKEALVFVGLILLAGAFVVQPVAFIALAALMAGLYGIAFWWRRRKEMPRPMPLLVYKDAGAG